MPHSPLHNIQLAQRRFELEKLRQQSLPDVDTGMVTPGMSGQEVRAWATPADIQATAHRVRQARAGQVERALAGASMEGLKRVMQIGNVEQVYPGRAEGGSGPTGLMSGSPHVYPPGQDPYVNMLNERAEKADLLSTLRGRGSLERIGPSRRSLSGLTNVQPAEWSDPNYDFNPITGKPVKRIVRK